MDYQPHPMLTKEDYYVYYAMCPPGEISYFFTNKEIIFLQKDPKRPAFMNLKVLLLLEHCDRRKDY